MRDPELVARAGYAAARLEQALERWRALHGLGGSADPLASYVGYSHKEPMGQPRVVIGVDAAEAEFFAEFLESHDCSGPAANSGPAADVGTAPGAGLMAADPRLVNGAAHAQANGTMHPPVNGPMHPLASGPQRVLANGAPRPSAPAAVSRPLATGPATAPEPFSAGPRAAPGAFGAGSAATAAGRGSSPAGAPASWNIRPGAAPTLMDLPSEPMVRLVDGPGPLGPPEYPAPDEPATGPQEAHDAMAAEMAGWSSGELPGQASEQLASWVAGDSGGRRLRRSRSAR